MTTEDTAPAWTRAHGFREGRKQPPSWDVDWRYGVTEGGEKLVREICGAVDSETVHIEVKRKRRTDGYFYVELEHDPGRRDVFVPSGLSITTADIWAFAIADSGLVLMTRTDALRTAIERNYGFPSKETDGSCPTHGRLISVWDLLSASKPGKPSRAAFGDFTESA
jgi:hypothetical protein